MTKEGSNFIREIAEAYQALEILPQREERIRALEAQSIADGERIARLEKRLIDRHNEMETLQARIRSLEVERDDASFRELVAQDQAASAVGTLRTLFSNVGEALKALQPPEAMVTERPLESSVPSPVEAAPTGSSEPTPEGGEPIISGTPNIDSQTTLGESAADPIMDAPTGAIQESAGQSPVTHSDAGTTITESSPVKPHGPYHGLCYFDVPGYISLPEWIEGGGTQELYFGRRTA
jgi:hypothetical protein